MDARNLKFVVVGALILGAIGTLAYISLKSNMVYAITVAEFRQDADRYKTSKLRIDGALTPSTHRQEQTDIGVRHTFTIQDKEDDSYKVDVLFVGPVPDTMREEGDVMVEGQLNDDGVLVASKVTPKCASKYEESVEGAYDEAQTYEAVSQN